MESVLEANATNRAMSYDILDEPNGRRTHLKVVCVGAGATGLYLAYQMERRMKNYQLTVYEKNKDIGGTWLESEILLHSSTTQANSTVRSLPRMSANDLSFFIAHNTKI